MIPAVLFLAVAAGAGGCAVDTTCDDVQAYQLANETDKVDAPEGLDDLPEANEMQIPRASPRDPREPGSPCLDIPPTLQSLGSGEGT